MTDADKLLYQSWIAMIIVKVKNGQAGEGVYQRKGFVVHWGNICILTTPFYIDRYKRVCKLK